MKVETDWCSCWTLFRLLDDRAAVDRIKLALEKEQSIVPGSGQRQLVVFKK
jgi:hypothetical protein